MDLEHANQAAGWFEQFIKHGSAVSCLLSLGFGWGLALLLSYPIHWKVKDADLATYIARIVAVAGSFLVTLGTWPNEYRLAWAGFMGVASPLLGLAALAILKGRAPKVYEQLSMRKIPPTTPTGEAP